MTLQIIKKYYNKETKKFYVLKRNVKTYKEILKEYDNFEKFAMAIKKDFAGADLYDFNLKNIDVSKYDLSKAIISSKSMIDIGIYNDSLFKHIKKDEDLSEIKNVNISEIKEEKINENLSNLLYRYEEGENHIYYISDLHISNKILNKYKKHINEVELRKYCHEIAVSLNESLGGRICDWYRYIFILGDVSFNFVISKIFYEELRKEIRYDKIFVILGNHELWDKTFNEKYNNVEEIIEEYKEMLKDLNVICLNNELFVKLDDKMILYSEQDINNMSLEDIRLNTAKSRFNVLGGIGFSGLNEEFNYNNGIYRNGIKSREEEKKQSLRFSNIYKKVKDAIGDKNLIVATHMPKDDWTKEKYNENWKYLWGHTHKNYWSEEDGKNIYADNQIGYNRNSFNFKLVSSSNNYDIFIDYNDGIYEITKEQYVDFYKGFKISFAFNRPYKRIYMIKKSGKYCFIMQNEKEELRILNGGNFKTLKNNDLNYYYDNLENYAKSINMYMDSYENALKMLSNEVKKIGGSGRIHGCIVDIDFYNHIYLNPFDGTKTPYLAYSITEKFVYKNILSLLKYQRDDLYNNYKKMIKNSNPLTIIENNEIISKNNTFVSSTEMYRISRIIKGLQYTTNYNVIRLWNDKIVESVSEESGRLLVSGIAFPEKIEKIEKVRKPKEQKIIKEKKTPEQTKKERSENYYKRVLELSEGNVEMRVYNGSREKMEFECKMCGYIWNERFDHFANRRKGKCPKCKK